jgi:hypothetical protein
MDTLILDRGSLAAFLLIGKRPHHAAALDDTWSDFGPGQSIVSKSLNRAQIAKLSCS